MKTVITYLVAMLLTFFVEMAMPTLAKAEFQIRPEGMEPGDYYLCVRSPQEITRLLRRFEESHSLEAGAEYIGSLLTFFAAIDGFQQTHCYYNLHEKNEHGEDWYTTVFHAEDGRAYCTTYEIALSEGLIDCEDFLIASTDKLRVVDWRTGELGPLISTKSKHD